MAGLKRFFFPFSFFFFPFLSFIFFFFNIGSWPEKKNKIKNEGMSALKGSWNDDDKTSCERPDLPYHWHSLASPASPTSLEFTIINFPEFPIHNVFLCPQDYFFLFNLCICHAIGVGWCFTVEQPDKCWNYYIAINASFREVKQKNSTKRLLIHVSFSVLKATDQGTHQTPC